MLSDIYVIAIGPRNFGFGRLVNAGKAFGRIRENEKLIIDLFPFISDNVRCGAERLYLFMKQENKTWSLLGFAWNLGYSIVIPLVLFALGGRFLDKTWGTSPWMLLLGILFSIIITTFIVYSKTIRIIKSNSNDSHKNHL